MPPSLRSPGGTGHGHLVILRAVGDDSFDPDAGDYGRSFRAEWGPVDSAETLVFHDRQASYDARVLATLAHADGIFVAGGDQADYHPLLERHARGAGAE